MVGNEIGLSGRFVNNVCDPVAKVLVRASQPALVMGDIQAFEATTSDVIPDVSIGVTLSSDDSESEVKIVGELKTYWTAPLHRFSLSDAVILPRLLPHFGICQPISAPYCFCLHIYRSACSADEEIRVALRLSVYVQGNGLCAPDSSLCLPCLTTFPRRGYEFFRSAVLRGVLYPCFAGP